MNSKSFFIDKYRRIFAKLKTMLSIKVKALLLLVTEIMLQLMGVILLVMWYMINLEELEL